MSENKKKRRVKDRKDAKKEKGGGGKVLFSGEGKAYLRKSGERREKAAGAEVGFGSLIEEGHHSCVKQKAEKAILSGAGGGRPLYQWPNAER